MKGDILKEKFKNKELIIGTHITAPEPINIEIMAKAGFDVIWIDWEHAPIDRKDLNLMIMGVRTTDAAVFVRVPNNDEEYVKPALEMGPDGIIFPNVKNAEEAKKAIDCVYYPPFGKRGFGPHRAFDYGLMSAKQYVEEESRKTWVILQIEDYKTVENLEEILALEGVDAIQIGPNDLSGSLGLLPDVGNEKVQRYLDMLVEKCHKAGVLVGTSFGYGGSKCEEQVKQWLARGVDWINLGSDVNFLLTGSLETIATVKKAAAEQ